MGRPRGRWEVTVWKDGCRFVPDTALAGGSKEGRKLDEGGWGGHGPKMGRSAIDEEAEMWEYKSVQTENAVCDCWPVFLFCVPICCS
jgi:hypothetical protein